MRPDSPPLLPFQQHPDFGAALGLLGRQIEFVDFPNTAPLLIVQRFGIRFAPRGPIWQGAESIDSQIASLRAAKLHLINDEATPDNALRAAGFRQIMTPAHVAELDLSRTPGDRIARLRPKWRNALRQAERSVFQTRLDVFCRHKHNWLLSADHAQQRAKGFRALPHDLLLAYSAANPASIQVWTACQGQHPIAAMLFITHGVVATYHIGWSGPEGRRYAAHHLLLMHAANALSAQGVRRLDLGTIDTENAHGLARFKIGTGATVRALGGTWLRIPGF